jgi:hypothetical protein
MLKEPAEIQIKAVEILENGFSPGYNHHSLPLWLNAQRGLSASTP